VLFCSVPTRTPVLAAGEHLARDPELVLGDDGGAPAEPAAVARRLQPRLGCARGSAGAQIQKSLDIR
jgi:hypothetical protein